MADEMRAFDAELSAQGFEVGDKLLEPEGLVGAFGTAMAAQIVGDAAEMRSELLDNPVPNMTACADAVAEEHRRPVADDRVFGANWLRHLGIKEPW
jgi:hypothetical protein